MNSTEFWAEVDLHVGMTEQESVLFRMRQTYGKTAYTENHISYRLVGLLRGGQRVFSIGDTWAMAIDRLRVKAAA